jgi:hypothetical protein
MRSLFQVCLEDLAGTPGSQPGVRFSRPIDKSKLAHFKPLSLDVIFHGCEDIAEFSGYPDAFARQCLRKPAV